MKYDITKPTFPKMSELDKGAECLKSGSEKGT